MDRQALHRACDLRHHLRGVDGDRFRRRAREALRRASRGWAPVCPPPCVAAHTVRSRMAPGVSRIAWACLSTALALYFVGTVIGVYSWLHGQDPFPGPSDIFYC